MNAEFWNMGGYALYVWGSFGVTLALMVIEPILVRQRWRAAVKRVARINRIRAGERP